MKYPLISLQAMFYDSDDDSDDEYYIYGFNGIGGYELSFNDWIDYGGYDSDDYFDNDFYSDNSDNSYGSIKTYDEFYEMCHSPDLFPDTKKFPIEFAWRISKIKSENMSSLKSTSNLYLGYVSEKLEITIFEQLWECIFYLREIIDVGFSRKELTNTKSYVNQEIFNLWNNSIKNFSDFKDDANIMCNHWFVWCNDMLVETLQSLIPFKLPYTAWEFIMSHLCNSSFQHTRMLSTKIGILSDNMEDQIVERFFVRDCILAAANLTTVLYRLLFGRQSCTDGNKVRFKLSFLLSNFSSSMERLTSFLDSSEPSSKCISHSVINQFSLNICDQFSLKPQLIDDEVDIFKTVGSNSVDYFSLLISGSKEKTYHLLCVDKNCLDSEKNVSFILIPESFHSEDKPIILSWKGVVAAIHSQNFEDLNSKTLTVWDVSDKGSFKERGEEIFSSDLNKIVKAWEHVDVELDLVTITISGILMLEKTIKIVFSIVPIDIEKCSSCVMAEYHTNKFVPKLTLFHKNLQLSFFPNSLCLGLDKTLAFIMNLDTNMLCAHSLEPIKQVIVGTNYFECGKDWKLLFNNNPNMNTIVIQKYNRFQVRLIDENLSIVNDITLNLGNLLYKHLNKIQFHVCENILYGFLNHQEDLYTTESMFLDSKTRFNLLSNEFLVDRFADSQMVHFSVDLVSQNSDLIFLDFGKNDLHYHDDNDIFIDDSASIQFCVTGFNKCQELVQLKMGVDIDAVYFDNFSIAAYCPIFEFSTIKFHDKFQDITKPMLKDAKDVLFVHKTEIEEIEAKKKQEMGRIEKLRKEKEGKNLKKEAKKAKQEQKKQYKWQKRIHAEKEASRATGSKYDNQNPSQNNELYVQLKDKIAKGDVFKSNINAWLSHKHYGFTTIELEKGKQSVYVHQNCLVKSEQKLLRIGSSIEFQLTWNPIHPRPKAINVKLLGYDLHSTD